jgi:hypothetical protein
MAGLPPPEGMTEEDYDSIHAAVVETVRGRWFLAEYARRSRVDEVKEMLAAIGRLEKVVTSNNALPPPVDVSPHLRLLAQRADEIAARLLEIADDLRDSGADPYLCDDLDAQVRAIASLPKGKTSDSAPSRTVVPETRVAPEAQIDLLPDFSRELPTEMPPVVEEPPVHVQAVSDERLLPQVEFLNAEPGFELEPAFPASPELLPPRVVPFQMFQTGEDPRLAALATIDSLSLHEKLALFS